jgi:hypothetical protein
MQNPKNTKKLIESIKKLEAGEGKEGELVE